MQLLHLMDSHTILLKLRFSKVNTLRNVYVQNINTGA
jgi:hypothetical protein